MSLEPNWPRNDIHHHLGRSHFGSSRFCSRPLPGQLRFFVGRPPARRAALPCALTPRAAQAAAAAKPPRAAAAAIPLAAAAAFTLLAAAPLVCHQLWRWHTVQGGRQVPPPPANPVVGAGAAAGAAVAAAVEEVVDGAATKAGAGPARDGMTGVATLGVRRRRYLVPVILPHRPAPLYCGRGEGPLRLRAGP